MTFKKLLLATTIVAMSTTAASAIEVSESLAGSPVTHATELSPPFNSMETLTVTVATDGGIGGVGANFPNANNLLVTINLPSGLVFHGAVTASTDYSASNPGTATVQNGSGQPFGSSVDFLIDLQGGNADELMFSFDTRFAGCASVAAGTLVTTSATVQTELLTNVENGGASAVDPLLDTAHLVTPCEDAVQVTSADDNDSAIPFAGNYTTLNNPTVGFIAGNIDAVSRDINSTPVDATDIEEVRFTVEIPDATGIAAVNWNGVTMSSVIDYPATGPASVDFVVPAADIATFFSAGPLPITFTPDGTNPIASQQISVSGTEVDFFTAPDPINVAFMANEAQPAADQDIDALIREGQDFGRFDWVSGPLGANSTVLRITGLDTTVDTVYTVNLTNAIPASANGSYTATLPANAEGVYSLNSRRGFGRPGDISELVGLPPFLNADVTLNLETDLTLDVDRLISASGTVTAYNDGSNLGVNLSDSTLGPILDSDVGNE